MVYVVWALGGMRWWSHAGTFVLSALAFVFALLPRAYNDPSDGQSPFKLYTWPKLIRFPFFWLGLAFLGYVAIQALNPAWTFASDGNVFWMDKVNEITWLPSGMKAPYLWWNPWRILTIYAAVWFTVCAVWVGVTRRRSLQTLFIVLVSNGILLAIIGLIQRLKGNGKVLWLFEAPTSYFVATIPYKNHAAAYFNLILALAAGLSFWFSIRSQRRFEKSSPAPLLVFGASLVAVMVAFTFSRAGAALMLGLVLIIVLAYFISQLRGNIDKRTHAISLALVLLLGGFAWVGASMMGVDRVTARFSRLFKEDRRVSVDNRDLVRRVTWQMAQDRLLFGWGAGCYRFGFPIYQLRHDQISYGSLGERVFWEHAHSDFVETLAEFGIVGCSLIVGMFGYGVTRIVKVRFWRNPLALTCVFGLGVALLHGWVDFPFQNPAILTTWCLLFVAASRWCELDDNTVA